MPPTNKPRRGIGGALFLIGLGAVFLLFELRPELNPLPVLAQFWPLILIFWGLGKIWDYFWQRRNADAPHSPRISGTAVAMCALLVLFVVTVARGRYTNSFDGLKHDVKTLDAQGAKTVHANIAMPAGDIRLSGGSSKLLEADFRYRESEGIPEVKYEVTNGTGEINIDQNHESRSHIRWGHSRNSWDLRVGNELPLELTLHMGAGQGELNLRDVPVTRLEVNMGAGQLDLDLRGDRKQDLRAVLHGGVGQATIRLPKGVGVRATAHGGIGSVDTSGLHRDGDEYVNDAYGKSKVTIELEVEGGIGQITLEVER